MTLAVYTARLGARDPDVLDITRKSGTGDGLAFAPSWTILRPALDAIARYNSVLRDARGCDDPSVVAQCDAAARARDAAWQAYREVYFAEMRASYRDNRGAWERLIARHRVVLTCYCPEGARCHRVLLGREILPKLGATWCGGLDLHKEAST